MIRPAVLAFALLILAALPAGAREACEGLGVETFVGKVPYFGAKAERVASPVAGGLSYVHPDDARINVSFRMQAVPQAPPTTRLEYLKDLRQRLELEVRKGPEGSLTEMGIFPYDPVAWTLRTRTPAGQDVNASGTLTVRVAPTCHLVASWKVFEQPILAGRIGEFASAMDAVRATASPTGTESEFLPDATVPLGLKALLFGFAVPLLASLALMFGLKGMLLLRRPGPVSRALAAGAAAATAAAVFSQVPEYLSGFEEGRYMDNAALLLLQVGLLVPAAALGMQRAVLSAFCTSACSGLALAIGSFLGWSPDPSLNMLVAVVLIVSSFLGLRLWWTQGTKTKRVAPRLAGAA